MARRKGFRNRPCREPHCRWPAMTGLVIDICQYHWLRFHYGKAWADHVHPDHPEAAK